MLKQSVGLYKRLNGIKSSSAVQGLNHTQQVVVTEDNTNSARFVRNRFFHSEEVCYGTMAILESISIPGKNMDYNGAAEVVSLLHDLGHPPGGHEGVDLIKAKFLAYGYDIEMDDNNQTFEVIKKHRLDVTPYEMASLLKYPNKAYEKRKPELLRYLKDGVTQDVLYFGDSVTITERPKRTVICECMDEADRNTYVASDNEDIALLRLSDSSFFQKELDSGIYEDEDIISFLLLVIKGIDEDDKTIIKKAFNDLRFMFHYNYYLGNNLTLVPIRTELIDLREKMFCHEVKAFIKHPTVIKGRDRFLSMLGRYVDWVLEGNYPSRTYKALIENANNDTEKAEYLRDMIFETSDLYILEWDKKQSKKNKKNK